MSCVSHQVGPFVQCPLVLPFTAHFCFWLPLFQHNCPYSITTTISVCLSLLNIRHPHATLWPLCLSFHPSFRGFLKLREQFFVSLLQSRVKKVLASFPLAIRTRLRASFSYKHSWLRKKSRSRAASLGPHPPLTKMFHPGRSSSSNDRVSSGIQDRQETQNRLFVWYEFKIPVKYPIKLAFGPRAGHAKPQTPKSFQFVGSNDQNCSKTSTWSVVCEGFYADLAKNGEIRGCEAEREEVLSSRLRHHEYRCLGIKILAVHSGPVAALRKMKMSALLWFDFDLWVHDSDNCFVRSDLHFVCSSITWSLF